MYSRADAYLIAALETSLRTDWPTFGSAKWSAIENIVSLKSVQNVSYWLGVEAALPLPVVTVVIFMLLILSAGRIFLEMNKVMEYL